MARNKNIVEEEEKIEEYIPEPEPVQEPVEKFSTTEYVTIRSSAIYPVEFEYDGENTFISPMGVMKKVDKSKLGKLPKAIRIVQ